MKNNSRPIQDLNNRKVRRSWDESFIVSKPVIPKESDIIIKDKSSTLTSASNKLEINVYFLLASIAAYRFF